jgi:hypothetical protein
MLGDGQSDTIFLSFEGDLCGKNHAFLTDKIKACFQKPGRRLAIPASDFRKDSFRM